MSFNNPPPGGGTPLRGNRIQIIQNENTMLKQQIHEMQHSIDNILAELQHLKHENIALKEQLHSNNDFQHERYSDSASMVDENIVNYDQNSEEEQNVNVNAHQYVTDEEELERETNWIVQRSKKNRSTANKVNQDQGNKQYNPPKTNSENNNINKQNAVKQGWVDKPPPINVVGVTSYEGIKNILKSANVQNVTITSLNNNVWKINTSDSTGYRNLSATLNSMKFEWYTYENKTERPNKVIIRGLHHTCTKEDIIEDLQNKGFNPLDAVNILKKERKEESNSYTYRKLPIFRVTFHRDDNMENIFKITSILNLRVKVEAVRAQTRLIPQCKRCQGFNHTKRYCQKEARCVKCAGKHDTENCEKPKTIVPKCINCKGNHPASYRGCEVAKELQKMRNKTRLMKEGTRKIQDNEEPLGTRTRDHQLLQPQYQNQTFQRLQQARVQQPFQGMNRQNMQPKTFAEALSPNNAQNATDNSLILNEILKNMQKINRRLDDQAVLNEKLIDKINAIIINAQNIVPQ